jgi:hypothetical protein
VEAKTSGLMKIAPEAKLEYQGLPSR